MTHLTGFYTYYMPHTTYHETLTLHCSQYKEDDSQYDSTTCLYSEMLQSFITTILYSFSVERTCSITAQIFVYDCVYFIESVNNC